MEGAAQFSACGYHRAVLRHIGSGLLWALLGYPIGVGLCWLLVSWLSDNRHDKSVEVAMTAFFAGGPLMAVLGFVLGVVRSIRR